MEVQKRLIELGYTDVSVGDGVFGAMAEETVEHFQGLNNLEVDDRVGPLTWETCPSRM